MTKMKYFGKTRSTDPFKYTGSGIHWKRHIAVHGKSHIKTLKIWSFDDIEACTKFAVSFSKRNNIVESNEWANLKVENGLDGGSLKGRKDKEETKKRKSTARLNKKHSQETLNKLSSNSGRAIAVTIDGIEYKTLASAAIALFPNHHIVAGRRRIKQLYLK